MTIPSIDDRTAAVAFLDRRIGHGIRPGLERVSGLLDYLANPHDAFPIIHVAGTNGKTTASRLASDLLGAHGLRVGTFVSPHLHRVEDRFLLSGQPIDEQAFTEAVRDIAWFVEEYEARSGHGITYFELTAALAFSIFAEAAVDVAVVEVGLGGRLDATNVADAAVSVLTGVAMDHMSYLGDSIAEIAREKAAILKTGGRLVTGPLPAAAEGPVTAAVADTGSRWFRFGDDFRVGDAVQAVGAGASTSTAYSPPIQTSTSPSTAVTRSTIWLPPQPRSRSSSRVRSTRTRCERRRPRPPRRDGSKSPGATPWS